MSNVPDQTVGVLGGMGPEATLDLLQRIIALTPARDDQDHIRVLVDSNPKVPSRIAAIIEKTGPSPAPALVAMARGLEQQGADFLVMPCNTAHHYYREIAAAVQIPFLNLPELVATQLRSSSAALCRVGLLASSALQTIDLYEPWMAREALETCYPGAACQGALMDLIRAVKAGRTPRDAMEVLQDAARDLENAGAEVLLVACTELSVLAPQLDSALVLVDAADVLARATVNRATGGTQERP